MRPEGSIQAGKRTGGATPLYPPPGRRFARARSEKGFTLLVTAMAMVFLVPAFGLMVDAAILMVVKAKLAAAADAAALSAARSLTLSLTVGAQTTDAMGRGTAFFDGNFPPGYLSTSNSKVTISLNQGTSLATASTLFITTTAQTDAPTYFMHWFGYNTVTVKASSQAARRDVNMLVVLDKSGSMNTVQPGTTISSCDAMKIAASSFVDNFSNNRDTLGLISFDASYSVDFAPAKDFNAGMKTAINSITCNNNTGTANALNQAYQQLLLLHEPAALNVIVLFTDGQPNGVTADYPVKMASDTRYGDGSSPGFPNPAVLYTMPPSPCMDAAGNTYSYNPATKKTYIKAPWNPSWNPFKVGDTDAGNANNDTGAPINTMRGVISEWNGGPAVTGIVAGVFGYIGNQNTISGGGGNCAFQTIANQAERLDVAFIPKADIYGNATVGYKTNFVLATKAHSGNDYYPSGPYKSQLRSDSPQTISNASYNAADAQGTAIRNDSTYNPVIYTIGLGGNDAFGVDTELLIRLANVQNAVDSSGTVITNSIYDPTKLPGYYAYAPNSLQLAQAFSTIASSVLRLSR